MLKLSKAYCCERIPCGPLGRIDAEKAWKKRFGRRRWATVTEVVKVCNGSAARRSALWAWQAIRRVLTDLGESVWLDRYYAKHERENESVFDLRTAKEIDADWDGTLDYC